MSPSTSTQTADARPSPSRLPRFLRPAPPAPRIIADPEKIRRMTADYRLSILVWSTIGYATFYFVRKNLAVAMPEMEHELGISKGSLGLFLTLHGVLYGVSKFANGFIGDRANAKVFMALGLLTSAAMNFCFGFSTAATVLGIFWMLNGWFQGMGFPPCARLITHWFSPKELATKMSIWNTSHTLGASIVLIMCGRLVIYDWRLCFFVPAGLAVLMACMLLLWLHDTPESVGLPEVEGTVSPDSPRPQGTGSEPFNACLTADASPRGISPLLPPAEAPDTKSSEDVDFKAILARKVFGNPWIWLFAVANAFVYTIRYGVLDWGPTFLKEAKGIELSHGAWMTASFEVAGLAGTLVAGWLTDRLFAGRSGRMCVFCMLLCGISLFLFWGAPPGRVGLNTALLMAAGFCIYGPQALIGVAAANLATRHAAATAVGLTGVFGYASTILSGWGLGLLVENYGWDAGFKGLIIVAALGTLIFIAAWPAKAHGYSEDT